MGASFLGSFHSIFKDVLEINVGPSFGVPRGCQLTGHMWAKPRLGTPNPILRRWPNSPEKSPESKYRVPNRQSGSLKIPTRSTGCLF